MPSPRRPHGSATGSAERPRHARCLPPDMDPFAHSTRNNAAVETLPAPAGGSLRHVQFADVLHALNPLQYLPGIGMIYRAATGDSVHPALQIAVAAASAVAFGNPVGIAVTMLAALGTALIEDHAVTAAASPVAMAQAARAYHGSCA
jgi:hypothetical protein